MAAQRAQWKVWSLGVEPFKLVFIHETSATTKLARIYGRAPRGQRVIGSVPHGHWKTTLITGLDVSGIRCAMTLD